MKTKEAYKKLCPIMIGVKADFCITDECMGWHIDKSGFNGEEEEGHCEIIYPCPNTM